MALPLRTALNSTPDTTFSAGSRESTSPWRHCFWPDAIGVALVALVVRLPAMFAPTQLGYDDGGYGVAAIAMRQGYVPFREIFSPQGPLFLPLVHVADLVGLHRLNAPRPLAVASGTACAVGVYAIAVPIMDHSRAIFAGGLTAISGVLLWTTGPLTGDGPAAAFAIVAVAVAVSYRRAPSRVKAVGVMILLAGALATKSLVVAPALVIAWVLVARRRWLDTLVVPIGVAVIVVLVSAPWGFGHVLDDYVRYHLDKTGSRKPAQNLDKLVRTFVERDTFRSALAVLGAAIAVVRRLQPRRPEEAATTAASETHWGQRATAGDRFLWWWAGITLLVLLAQDPLYRNHLSAFVAPLALLVARARPSWRLVAIAGIVTLPFQAMTLRPLLLPHDYSGTTARIVAGLRELPQSAWALSDEPGLVWRAGLGTDPFFVDPSVMRIDSGVRSIKITEARLLHAAAARRVCAVAVTASVRFGQFVDLPDRLHELGYRRTLDVDDRRGLYVRSGCRP